MNTVLKLVVTGMAAIAALGIASVLFAVPFMIAWDFVIPKFFGLPKIGFFESLALCFVSSCLFKANVSSTK